MQQNNFKSSLRLVCSFAVRSFYFRCSCDAANPDYFASEWNCSSPGQAQVLGSEFSKQIQIRDYEINSSAQMSYNITVFMRLSSVR